MKRGLAIIPLLLLAACQMRPYNPLLGKWDGAPPNENRLLIFNNDGSFVLETEQDNRKAIQEGKYFRTDARVELRFPASEIGPERSLDAVLENDNRTLTFSDAGTKLVFNKR